METMVQLLLLLGPCCGAKQESRSTFRAAFILKTPGDPAFPTSTGLQGVNHTPFTMVPGILYLMTMRRGVGAVNRKMLGVRSPQLQEMPFSGENHHLLTQSLCLSLAFKFLCEWVCAH